MNTDTKTTARDVLLMIAQDMKDDAARYDGMPFTGATVAEYMGNHGAAIAALADMVATLLPPDEPDRVPVAGKDYLPEAISDQRVEEIVEHLNSFVVHEYEYGTDLVNGRAVPVSTIVGSDFNLDKAVDWALGQPECSTAVEPGGDYADVELLDGTVIVWSPDIRRWEIAAGTAVVIPS